MRTANDFVSDMLSKGLDWIDVLCVARAIRRGDWRAEAKQILIDSGKMPQEVAEQNRLRDEKLKQKTKLNAEYEQQAKEARSKEAAKRKAKLTETTT